VQNETRLRKWGSENTNKHKTPYPRRTHAPGYHVRPRCSFWSWQMWDGGRALACAAGLGRAKRDRSQEMGPRKHKQTQNSPSTAHTCLLKVQDTKCDQGAPFVLCKCGKPCTCMCCGVGPCKTRPVSGNGAQKTQTNTELPIHGAYMPAEGPGYHVRPKCSFWSWQMWNECTHACAAGLGRAKRDRSQEMGSRKHKQTQNSISKAYTCLMKVQDIKCNPGAAFGLS